MFPVTLTDDLPHVVTIARKPERIVSLAPSITETLFAIGAGPRVVGDSTYCDYPEEAKRLPKVGSYISPNVEKIIALQPDLVLAARGVPRPALDALQRLHLPVFGVDPKNMQAVQDTIRTLGRVTGALKKANEVADGMNRSVKAVQASLGPLRSKPVSGLIEIGHDPEFIAGTSAFVSDLFRLAGGRNVAPPSSTAFPRLSTEAVLALQPEVLIVTEPGVTLNSIKKRPGWNALNAVKQGHVFSINGDLVDRSSPRTILALQEIARDLRHVTPAAAEGRGKMGRQPGR